MEKLMNLFERLVVAMETLASAANSTPVAAQKPAEVTAAAPTGPTAAEKAAATKKAAKNKAAAEEADMLGTAAPAATEITIPMLQNLVSKLLAAGVVPKATIKGVIETVGNAPSISTIKPENYQATFEALSVL